MHNARPVALKWGARCAFWRFVNVALGVGVGVTGGKIAHGSMLVGADGSKNCCNRQSKNGARVRTYESVR